MGVEFNENQSNNFNYQPKKSGLAGLVIKMGLAKDDNSAQRVLIVVAILFFVLAIYFFTKAF